MADDFVPGPGRRHRLRDRDRRTRQGRRRAALPRRRHRGPRRQGDLRQRLGAAGRRQVRPRAAAGRAVPDPGALRRRPGRRAGRAGDAGPASGATGRCSTSTPSRPATSSPGPPSWRCPTWRSPPAASASRPCRRSEIDEASHDRRAVHDPLARRARPGPRRGRRRLLVVRRRARHERLHLHRPGRRLHRRRRRGLALRRHRRDVRPAARRRAVPGAARCSTTSREPATPSGTSRACSTARSG